MSHIPGDADPRATGEQTDPVYPDPRVLLVLGKTYYRASDDEIMAKCEAAGYEFCPDCALDESIVGHRSTGDVYKYENELGTRYVVYFRGRIVRAV